MSEAEPERASEAEAERASEQTQKRVSEAASGRVSPDTHAPEKKRSGGEKQVSADKRSDGEKRVRAEKRPAVERAVERTIFQQDWWLNCVTDGQYGEVTATSGGQTVGWLPYIVQRRWGVQISGMPLLTHTLGPVIVPGSGRPSSQLLRRFTITSELLEKLPRFAHFRQILPPTELLSLPFQAYGCHVKVQSTFIADCSNIDEAWKNMRDKTRNLIRRSQECNAVSVGADPDEFLRFYELNCEKRSRINRYEDPKVRKLLNLCAKRDQGSVIVAKDQKSGAIAAAVFVVWDSKSMHFLMSTRSAAIADNGAVSLLAWTAMNEAHKRGLKFDFDGVTSLGTFRFLSGFGGEAVQRLIVEKFSWIYHSLDKMRALAYGNAQRTFD